ncbi:MAG: O-antigen ligase family protein [Microgenomates group bacterium]
MKFKKIDNLFFNLLLLAIFLIKLPSFYILPFLKNNFLTSQALARILVVIIFIFNILKFKFNLKFKNNQKNLFFLIFVFFLTESFSVFYSVNVLSFLARYKDVLISFLAFLLFYFYQNKKERIVQVFLLSTIFSIVYQFFLISDGEFLKSIIYDKHINLVFDKLERQNRLYTDTYDEALIPFLFINLRINFFIQLILFLSIIFFSFYSNIRSRFLMMSFSLIFSFIFFKKTNLRKIFIIFSSFLIFVLVILNISFLTSQQLVVDRFFSADEAQDISPINFRLNQIQEATMIANNKLIGLGLGNYFDVIENNQKYGQGLLARSDILNIGSNEYVHNIFGLILSELGWIGFIIIFLVLFNFAFNDYKVIRTGREMDKALVLSFWSLFLYGLFNPIIPLSYQFLFWGLRGLLI